MKALVKTTYIVQAPLKEVKTIKEEACETSNSKEVFEREFKAVLERKEYT